MLGPAGIAARIVLGGKEGSTGLMPPLGAALTDEQIAAALTYIRREWGHGASAGRRPDSSRRADAFGWPHAPLDGGRT